MSCGITSVHLSMCLHVVTLENWLSLMLSTDARRFFFSVRVINRWNSLSQEAAEHVQEPVFRVQNSRVGFFMDSWSA